MSLKDLAHCPSSYESFNKSVACIDADWLQPPLVDVADNRPMDERDENSIPDLHHVVDSRPVRRSTRSTEGAPLFDTETRFPTERKNCCD